jgi:hypothetical protein
MLSSSSVRPSCCRARADAGEWRAVGKRHLAAVPAFTSRQHCNKGRGSTRGRWARHTAWGWGRVRVPGTCRAFYRGGLGALAGVGGAPGDWEERVEGRPEGRGRGPGSAAPLPMPSSQHSSKHGRAAIPGSRSSLPQGSSSVIQRHVPVPSRCLSSRASGWQSWKWRCIWVVGGYRRILVLRCGGASRFFTCPPAARPSSPLRLLGRFGHGKARHVRARKGVFRQESGSDEGGAFRSGWWDRTLAELTCSSKLKWPIGHELDDGVCFVVPNPCTRQRRGVKC